MSGEVENERALAVGHVEERPFAALAKAAALRLAERKRGQADAEGQQAGRIGQADRDAAERGVRDPHFARERRRRVKAAATSFVFGALALGAIFLFVRTCGEADPRAPLPLSGGIGGRAAVARRSTAVTGSAGGGHEVAFEPTQEMRFAVVLYGGVSLAIYINGVVQELLHLVRATAPSLPSSRSPSEPLLVEPEEGECGDDTRSLRGSELVYRRLGQMVRADGAPLLDAGADSPILTRFVVDVLSGSSAGGLNAIFLAKALANGQRLDEIKRVWIDEADIDTLLNDRGSRIDGLLREQKPPPSVLNSPRMYSKLLEALGAMDLSKPAFAGDESCFVDELDCWITTTDILGLSLPIALFDGVVNERRHKNVFRFVYRNRYATGEKQNDLKRTDNPFLAFAARCSSSFPFAFEPMVLTDIDKLLGIGPFTEYHNSGSGSGQWERFYPDYVRASKDASLPSLPFPQRAFGDGGYLDNKPFTWATQTLERRRSDWPVDRRLIYIEPDPEAVRPESLDPERPDAIQNVRAARGLPSYETIREDLASLLDKNREIGRLETLRTFVDRSLADVDRQLNDGSTTIIPAVVTADQLEQWRNTSADTLFKQRGILYASYYRLRIASVLDELAQLVGRHLSLSEGSDEVSAMRCLVQAWFERAYPENGGGESSQTNFLFHFDLGYRQRRLNYLLHRVDKLLRLQPQERVVAELPSDDATWRDSRENLLKLRRRLNKLYVERRLAGRDVQTPGKTDPITTKLLAVGIDRSTLLDLLQGALGFGESVQKADDLIVKDGLQAKLSDAAAEISERLNASLRAAARSERDALSEAQARAAQRDQTAAGEDAVSELAAITNLIHVLDYYENYDAASFPLTYSKIGEADRVEVIRISPRDATSLINENTTDRRKLSGAQLHHFGGFMKRSWRRNDMLWGRLDAAERIIDTLLPLADPPDPQIDAKREQLREQAHKAILSEEFDLQSRSELGATIAQELMNDETDRSGLLASADAERLKEAVASTLAVDAVYNYLHDDFTADRTLDADPSLKIAGRATRIVGLILGGISEKYSKLNRPARWLTRIGQAVWTLAEAATPRTFREILTRYWLALLLIASLVMIIGGALFGAPATTKAGWITLLIVATAKFLIWLTGDALHGRYTPIRILVVLVVAAILALSAVEIGFHLSHDVNTAVAKLPHFLHRFDPWYHAD